MDGFYATRLHGFPPNFTSHEGLLGVAIAAEAVSAATPVEGVASLVVVLGSSLSLVGLVFAFITYSLFSDLRNLSGTTLMNLLAALFMAQLLYVIGVGGVQDPDLCSALSLALQYVRLTVLCWLTASAHHVYSSYRPTAGPDARLSSSFLRYSLFGWGAPLLCLASAAAMQVAQDGPQVQHLPRRRNAHVFRPAYSHPQVDRMRSHEALILGQKLDRLQRHNITYPLGSSFLANDVAAAEGDCWFPDGAWSFGLGFLAPAVMLLLADAVLLVKSALLVRFTSALLMDRKASNKMRVKRQLQLRLFARVSFLIGGVTALGAAARISSFVRESSRHDAEDTKSGGSALWLSFDVANALEGIFVTMCVTCDCGVLRLYTRSLRKRGKRKRVGSSSRGRSWRRGRQKGSVRLPQSHPTRPSKSTSLQLLTWEPTPDAV